MIMLRLPVSEDIRERLILYIQHNQIGETTSSLGAILFNLHEIVEDGESLLVTTVERFNWGDSIVSVEKVREPMLEENLEWM
jgi:hypothetical protein